MTGQECIMNTYNRFNVTLESGEGMFVFDDKGKKYLDFVSGIAVNCLGHNDKELVAAISAQAEKMIHCSNLYYTKPQMSLAKKLVDNSCFENVFFCNSGAEAVEAAMKLSRKYGCEKGKFEIIAMNNSFHGRTMGAITATGQHKYKAGFEPLLPGVKHVDINDFDALKAAASEKTAAILLEPIQGEGGINAVNKDYLEKARALCDSLDALLIFDEVQCGIGRLGALFAYQKFGVLPDAVCVAKGLGGGVPIGAMLAGKKAGGVFKPGDHASTFGGNPLSMAAGNVVVDRLLGGLLDNVVKQGEYLGKRLNYLKSKYTVVSDVRGMGLLQGIGISVPAAQIVGECLSRGLLLINAGSNVLRFLPSFIVSEKDIDDAISIIETVFNQYL